MAEAIGLEPMLIDLKTADVVPDRAMCATMAALPDQAEALKPVRSPAEKAADRATVLPETVAEARATHRSAETRLAEAAILIAELQEATMTATAEAEGQAEVLTQEVRAAEAATPTAGLQAHALLTAEVAAQEDQALAHLIAEVAAEVVPDHQDQSAEAVAEAAPDHQDRSAVAAAPDHLAAGLLQAADRLQDLRAQEAAEATKIISQEG